MSYLNLLFPKKCIYCKKQGEYICSSCFSNLEITFIRKIRNKHYDSFIFLDQYKNKTRNKIISAKFNYKPYILKGFADIVLNNKKIIEFIKTFDYITYVPMTRFKENGRGFNQSKVLAESLSTALNIPCINILDKAKNNKVQSKLNKQDRIVNVKDVFEINKKINSNSNPNNNLNLSGKKLVLIDDIYTTGATINECSRVLKQNEVKEICALVLAKA